MIENKYNHIQTNTKKNKEKKWKRMRQVTEGLVLLLSCRKNFWLQPSRGYNQPRRGKRLRQFSFCLPNIFVVSNGTNKEKKSFDNVLFICTIFFYSKIFIFVLPARVQPRREKASTMFFFCNTSYFVICPSCQESELWLQGEGKG